MLLHLLLTHLRHSTHKFELLITPFLRRPTPHGCSPESLTCWPLSWHQWSLVSPASTLRPYISISSFHFHNFSTNISFVSTTRTRSCALWQISVNNLPWILYGQRFKHDDEKQQARKQSPDAPHLSLKALISLFLLPPLSLSLSLSLPFIRISSSKQPHT